MMLRKFEEVFIMSIEGKVVLITGASSGIGEATARLLAQNGAKVALSARREDKLQKITDEIGNNAIFYKSDVTDLNSLKQLVAMAKEKFGHVDVLFANAGIMPASNISQLKINDWMQMVDINVKGVLNSMAAVLPEFTEQHQGQIIVTSSLAGIQPVPGNAIYTGTKFFIRGMFEAYRSESAMEKNNIKTTVLYPGAVQTELLNTVAPSKQKEQAEEFYKAVGIKPSAIAKAVLYAASQDDSVDVSELMIRPINEI